MSHRRQSAAIIIARKHQSAPKEHWADKEIAKAAEEMHEGRYVGDSGPEIFNHLNIALSAGTAEGVATGKKPRLSDFQGTHETYNLGNHPRVVEALEKMRAEQDTLTNPEQIIEMHWRIHETNAELQRKDQWDGQERWQGKDNEEMRKGRLLTPYEFYTRLCEVIGRERVILLPNLVKTHPLANAGRLALVVKNPNYSGIKPPTELKNAQAQKIRQEGLAKMNLAKKYRARGLNALADTTFDQAGELARAATEMLIEASAEVQLAESEFLRVGTLQWPLGTEYMLMNFNEYNVPTTAKFIGWRTALLTMVRSGAITEEEAQEAFPCDATDQAASWYREQLYVRRNMARVQ